MSLEFKRRAVFTVLSEYLREESLWLAMWRWQNQFADKSQYELNGFLSQCRDIPEIVTNRSQLYRQLISMLMESDIKSLKADPIDFMLKYQKQQEELGRHRHEVVSGANDWSPVFSRVMGAMFGQMRSDTARQVKRYAIEHAMRNGLAQDLTYAFTLWDGDDDRIDVSKTALPQLKKLLNFVYIGMCEYLGPVESDKLLSQSIRIAEPLSQSPTTNPRHLLEK